MELKFKNANLLTILSAIKGVVPSRQTFPIHGMVFIQPTDEGCYFYTQGMEAQIRYFSKDLNIKKPSPKLVSVLKLYEISRNFPQDSDITLSFKESTVTVSCEEGLYRLKSLPTDDFPLMSEPGAENIVKLPQQDLKYLLEKTDFCMAVQDPRSYMNGLFFSLEENKLSVVATDSHRLAVSFQTVASKVQCNSILPRDTVTELKRLLSDKEDDTEISIDPQKFVISLKDIQISAKALSGQFPNYKAVIPKDFSIEITLIRDTFLRSLQRASAIVAAPTSGESHVNLTFSENKLHIKSSNLDGEDVHIKQTIEYQGDTFEISFNTHYLQDVIKVLDTEKICLQMRNAGSGVRIIGVGSKTEEYIVMPMRL